MVRKKSKTCLVCGKNIEQNLRGPPRKYCVTCGREKKDEQDNESKRKRRMFDNLDFMQQHFRDEAFQEVWVNFMKEQLTLEKPFNNSEIKSSFHNPLDPFNEKLKPKQTTGLTYEQVCDIVDQRLFLLFKLFLSEINVRKITNKHKTSQK